jgi:hypothetical protein
MPTVTIQRSISLQELSTALQEKLGSQYQVTQHGNGLKVRQTPATTASVRLVNRGGASVISVHGGGLLITRLVNELGIAKKVASAIQGM